MKSRRQTKEESPTSPVKSSAGDGFKRRTTYIEEGDLDTASVVTSTRALSVATGRALSIVSTRASSIASSKFPPTPSANDVPPVPRLPISPRKALDRINTATTSRADSALKGHDSIARKYAILKHGRLYLRDGMPEYPFPCDTDELNRQTTKTLLAISLLGTPSLSRSIHNPPTRVLEVGCGTGLWSSLCHQHFIRLGAAPIKFFGTDIAPVSPNLRGHGVDWEFLQHDLTKALPYWDESFDLIIVKDLAFIARPDAGEARLLDEYFRILRRGGTLEIWESDLPIRALLPPALHTRRIVTPAARQAERTGSYLLGPEIGFSESRNKCIREFNGWIRDSLEDRGLNPSPSTEMGALLLGERRFAKGSTSCHRVAIPLGEAKWEQDPSTELRSEPPGSRPSSSYKRIEDLKIPPLTAHQLSLRSTALSLAVQTIESLEPILKKAAALNGDNWDRWWDEMMSSLLDEKNTSSGECLEFGVWWGTKA